MCVRIFWYMTTTIKLNQQHEEVFYLKDSEWMREIWKKYDYCHEHVLQSVLRKIDELNACMKFFHFSTYLKSLNLPHNSSNCLLIFRLSPLESDYDILNQLRARFSVINVNSIEHKSDRRHHIHSRERKNAVASNKLCFISHSISIVLSESRRVWAREKR